MGTAITVTASYTDELNTAESRTGAATSSVANVNDAPSISDSTFTIVEDASEDTVVGIKTGTDMDGDTLTYSITAGNDDGLFAIDSSSGAITVAAALDHETTPTHSLIVTATDAGSLSTSATVTVTVRDLNDNTPVFAQTTYLSTLNNTDSVGTQLVIAAATDADITLDYSTVTYSLTSVPDNGLFVINSSSGAVKTAGALVNSSGLHSLTLSAFDGTNTGTAVLSVNVKDTTAPVITISGGATVTHEAGTIYTDGGASAVDEADGSVKVTSSGIVTAGMPGTYTITYSATDASSNTTTVIRLVEVVDTTGPVISLLGEAVAVTAYGLEYVDPGVTAQDLIDGDVSDLVEVLGQVDTTRLGTYEIHYSATDKSG
ncbi:MAG: DUF5011 domain-containing protein, partial [Arenicellales bacterium]|nr:DUF5011 domain-containing protein [Arenicellales bacterium]